MRAKLAGVCLFAAVLALATWAPAQEGTPTTITDIRQESTDRSTRLIVECTGPLAYTYYSPDPLTLVVDIPEVDASQVPARVNVGTREVESLRVTSLARADGRNLARVEVRLASLVPYQIYSKDKALNLVFERPASLASAPEPAAPAAPAPASVAAAAPPPEPVAAGVLTPVEPPTGPRATRIVSVSRDELGGLLAFTVKADGRLKYRDFLIPNPDRLVLDFADVTARASVRTIDVGEDPVRRVRLGQFSAESPKVARLVLDLTQTAPYRIIDGADGVRIVFGESGEPAPVAHAPLAAMRAPEPAAPAAAATALPAAAEPLALPLLPEPQAPAPPSAPAEAAAAPERANIGTACGITGDLGTPISLDFKDGDLQDIFRLFSDISGLNVVVNPGVTGKVTLKLNEVPWARALELILKTNKLGCVFEDNVIRIARLSDLQVEADERRKLNEAKELEGELVDFTRRISYAKADALSTVLKQSNALSARGQINTDVRTNTIIIKDLPIWLEKAKGLIAELDTATPQVEIEARIVVTTRNFTRDLGIQWGFGGRGDPPLRQHHGPHLPELDRAERRRRAGHPRPRRRQPRAGRAVVGGGNRDRGSRVRREPAGEQLQHRDRHLDGQHPRELQPRRGADGAGAPGARAPPLDSEGHHPEQPGRRDQAGRPDPHPDPRQQHGQRPVQGRGADPPGHPADHGRRHRHPEPGGREQLGGLRQPGERDPPINTQSAKTIVLVKDGQTAVVGGIYQSTETTTQNQTPFLSKIPVLGYLFKSKAVDSRNNELLLFITPRIVKS